MSLDTTSEDFVWPINVEYELVNNQSTNALIQIRPGITTLVGPNGSGKTRALRAIKSKLMTTNRVTAQNRKVHFLSAGRSSPFESFRSKSENPYGMNSGDAAIGNVSYVNQWWDFESVTGDLMVFDPTRVMWTRP